MPDSDSEKLNEQLNDPHMLQEYKAPYDTYRVSIIPRILGWILVGAGTIFYGRKPTYLKFRAIEVIARVPYFSWASAMYTLLTLFYTDEERAMRYSRMSMYARYAQDNETMHVVVVSKLAREEHPAGFIRHTLIPVLFASVYFWASYILYFIHKRWAFELNYVFENHAFAQYDEFIKINEERLMYKAVGSEFLTWYGRTPRNQYEFFRSVRNDEIIHRNTSIRHITGR